MRFRGVALLTFSFLTSGLAVAAGGQEGAIPAPGAVANQSGQNLPEAPLSSTPSSASVSGTVLDGSGAAVPGASVSLTGIGGAQRSTMNTGAEGEFAFNRISPGAYVILVTVRGFQRFTSAKFILTPQQTYELPNIVLLIAGATTEVEVRPTEVVAAEQMKAAEKQRVFGVIPNFYTSYVWDAAPLNAKQKYSLALRETFDPVSFVGISFTAGIEQASNAFPGYGQGAEGYGKRWGARFADGRTGDLLSHAVFPSLFHQDPRYFYQGSGSRRSRLAHAVSYAFVARSDSGRLMPNYSYLLGDMCSGALSNAYYPPSSRGANLVFTNAAIGLAGRAGANIVLEFFSRRLTTNVHAQGKVESASGNP